MKCSSPLCDNDDCVEDGYTAPTYTPSEPLSEFPSEETGETLGDDFVPADAFDELALDHELTLDKLEDAKTQVDVWEEVNADLRDELEWLYDRYDALMNLVVIANR